MMDSHTLHTCVKHSFLQQCDWHVCHLTTLAKVNVHLRLLSMIGFRKLVVLCAGQKNDGPGAVTPQVSADTKFESCMCTHIMMYKSVQITFVWCTAIVTGTQDLYSVYMTHVLCMYTRD